jgi:hypothetical protein
VIVRPDFRYIRSMEGNPYAPPKAPVVVTESDGDSVAAATPLYTTWQMALAAFLGSPVAGAWLLAADLKALGQPVKARRTLWWGVLATIVSLGLAFVLPDKFPNSVIPLAGVFLVRAYGEQLLGGLLKAHEQADGALRSWWRVVGIGLLSAVIVLTVLAIAVFTFYMFVGEQALV